MPEAPTGQTGGHEAYPCTRIVRFGRYDVRVRLDSSGLFLGIDAVVINKDFMDAQQRQRSLGRNLAEELYEDD